MRAIIITIGLILTVFSVSAEKSQHYEVTKDEKVIANIHMRQLQPNELLISRQSAVDSQRSYILSATFEHKQLSHFSLRSSSGKQHTSETFSQQNNHIRWKSPKDEDATPVDTPYIYLSPDFTPIYTTEIIKRIASNTSTPINIAPGGLFHIQPEQIFHDKRTNNTLTLFQVVGRSVRPDYYWLTADFNFVAAFDQNTSYYDRQFKHLLPTLKEIYHTVEQAHWEALARKLTHPLPQNLLIKDVTIFDAKNARFLAGQSVLIQDGKISRVAPRVRLPAKTKIIDGKGKTLIPGLWDMHAHIYEVGGIFQIAGGVINARDKGNGIEITERKAKMDSGKLIGPRLYLSGFIDKRSDYNTGINPPVDTLNEALERVQEYKNQGYSDIKLYGSIPVEWVKPIGEKAHSLGMTLTGHIPEGMKSSDAIKAGFDEVTHSNYLLLEFLDLHEIDTRTRARHTHSALNGGTIRLDSEAINRFIKLLKKHNTVIDPTLVGYTAMFTHQEGQFDPRLENAKHHLPPRVYQSFMTPQMEVTAENRMAYKASAITITSLVKLLIDNHITVVPGTDDLPGLVLHNELMAYHRMGLPITEVLKMATINAAKVAKMDDRLGSISTGKRADLVLIEGDLSTNLALLNNASLVIKGDVYYVPKELYSAVGVRSFTHKNAGL